MAASEQDIAINQWLEGKLPDEEFLAIVGSETYQKYRQIVAEVDSWTPSNEDYIPDLKAIKEASGKKEAKEVAMWQRTRMLVAATVTLLLVAVMVLWNFDDRVEVSAGMGKVEKITLPDGASTLYLSAGSSASWNEVDWTPDKRELELDGKGYFEVAKGGTFLVNGANASIMVLGTKFEFQEYFGIAEIVCFEGKVQAISKLDTTILVGGEARLLEEEGWASIEMPEQGQPTWIQGLSTFKNAPLIKVIRTLEQEYDIQINYDGVNIKRQFTGSFPNDDLKLALKIVFTPLQISYSQEGKKLVLSE
ncbi:FecR family protein [Marinoscillum sp. MHG1-6]|uniref:FecR family protein n=1 Tax=Marinoscillum sp. MHG1-6 TaxID=2959627 RepID=UPI002157F611|nr:FecR domain-containing protein [Marinoscillum sp. MHG1-6]